MVTEKKIKLTDLKIGMIISMDIVNKFTNELVLPKGTVLDEDSLLKLKTYYIEAGVMQNDTMVDNYQEPDERKIQEQEPEKHEIQKQEPDGHEIQKQKNLDLVKRVSSLPEDERKLFFAFKTSYNKGGFHAKKSLNAVAVGKQLDINEFFDITNGIINKLNTKSEIFSYLNYLKLQDDYTYSHSLNVSLFANIFGKWLNMEGEEIVILTSAGMLLDIGKTKVSDYILNKKGKLTKEEFEQVKMHAQYGYDILRGSNLPEDVKLAVLQHHERIDGSGYPHGLHGSDINKYAKIIAICDVYDAMVCERPYRDKICAFDVIKEFERDNFNKMDTEYLMVFLKNIAYNYLGKKVMLSDERIGEVIFINSFNYSAPMIQLEDDTILDLAFEKNVHIKTIL